MNGARRASASALRLHPDDDVVIAPWQLGAVM